MPIRSKAQWRTLHAIASRGGISKRKLSKLKRETRVKYSRLPKYKRRRNPTKPKSSYEYWVVEKTSKNHMKVVAITGIFEKAMEAAFKHSSKNIGRVRVLAVGGRWEF